MQEVESDTLGSEDRTRGSFDFEHCFTRSCPLAGTQNDAHVQLRIDACKNVRRSLHASDDSRFLGDNPAASVAIGHEVLRGEIACADVFGERNGNGVMHDRAS